MAQLLKPRNIGSIVCTCLVCVFLFACSAELPKPSFDLIQYDYQINSPYPLTKQHQFLAIVLDAPDIELPEFALKDMTLPMKVTEDIKKAQVLVQINVSDSFLIQRKNALRSETVFPTDGKGYVESYEVLRGDIRTHYSIEIIDLLNDVLIYDRQGAIDHGIETRNSHDKQKNIAAIKQLFFEETPVARYGLISEILKQLEHDDFNLLRVKFEQQEFKIVKSLTGEPRFEKAFTLLQANNKHQAQQALDVYNTLLKSYENKNDELSQAMLQWLEPGLTACTAIVNHPQQDRYPYQSE